MVKDKSNENEFDTSLSKAFQSVSLEDGEELDAVKSTSTGNPNVFPFPRHGQNNLNTVLSPSILSSLNIPHSKTTKQPKKLDERNDNDQIYQSLRADEGLFYGEHMKAGTRSKGINIVKNDFKASQEGVSYESRYFSMI